MGRILIRRGGETIAAGKYTGYGWSVASLADVVWSVFQVLYWESFGEFLRKKGKKITAFDVEGCNLLW